MTLMCIENAFTFSDQPNSFIFTKIVPFSIKDYTSLKNIIQIISQLHLGLPSLTILIWSTTKNPPPSPRVNTG